MADAASETIEIAKWTYASGNASVLDNDSDPDGDSLSASITQPPLNGTATMNADGTFTYTPNAAYIGPDSFDYTIDDGHGHTATATVNITVTAPPSP